MGAYIFKKIAEEYEVDTSYRKSFILTFISEAISIGIYSIPVLVISILRISGIMFNNMLIYVLIPVYIGIFIITLYFGSLVIQKFYLIKLRESFSILKQVIFYNIITSIALYPLVISILSLSF